MSQEKAIELKLEKAIEIRARYLRNPSDGNAEKDSLRLFNEICAVKIPQNGAGNIKACQGKSYYYLSCYYGELRRTRHTHLPESTHLLSDEPKLLEKELHYAKSAVKYSSSEEGLKAACKIVEIYCTELKDTLSAIKYVFHYDRILAEILKSYPRNRQSQILHQLPSIPKDFRLKTLLPEISVDIEERQKKVIQDITNYLRSPTHFSDNDKNYLINDIRTTSKFYSQERFQSAVKIRLTNYFRAAQLLSRYFPLKDENAIANVYNPNSGSVDINDFSKILRNFANLFVRGNGFIASGSGFDGPESALKAIVEAEALITWTRKIPIIVTMSKSQEAPGCILVQVDMPISRKHPEQSKRFEELENPSYNFWYQRLPDWQKAFFTEKAREVNRNGMESVFFTQPSTIRCYPDLPFHMRHGLLVFKAESNELIYSSFRSRSSVITPYGMQSEADRLQSIVMENVLQFLQSEHVVVNVTEERRNLSVNQEIKIPVLYQTLLSKTHYLDYGNKMVDTSARAYLNFNNLQRYFRLLSNEKNVTFTFIHTNYAINEIDQNRRIGGLIGDSHNNVQSVAQLLEFVKNFMALYMPRCLNQQDKNSLKALTLHLTEICQALALDPNNLNALRDLPLKNYLFRAINFIECTVPEDAKTIKYLALVTFNYLKLQKTQERKVNIFLAALENMLVRLVQGLVLSSCKSGKDRNGLLQMAIDSLETFFLCYRSLPKIFKMEQRESEEKIKFIGLFGSFFSSGHQQLLASTNALGCIGLKSVTGVMPKEYTDKIHPATMQANNLLADLNRPKINDEKKFPEIKDLPSELDESQNNVLSLLTRRTLADFIPDRYQPIQSSFGSSSNHATIRRGTRGSAAFDPQQTSGYAATFFAQTSTTTTGVTAGVSSATDSQIRARNTGSPEQHKKKKKENRRSQPIMPNKKS